MSEELQFKYLSKKQISHNTYIFTYEIPNNLPLGLDVGKHIAIE